MKRTVVIGIGCTLMKDDGIGVRVAQGLKDELENIEVIIAETDFLYGAFAIHDGDYVIVLDAIATGKRAGHITSLPLEKAASLQRKQFSQHEINLIDLIFSKYKNNKGLFLGIEAAEIGYGCELSKKLIKKFNSICKNIKKKILRYQEALKYNPGFYGQ